MADESGQIAVLEDFHELMEEYDNTPPEKSAVRGWAVLAAVGVMGGFYYLRWRYKRNLGPEYK